MPFVSIIISNYNGRELLRECLTSLQQSRYSNYEIIVVDAGSSDGSPEMVGKDFPSVRLLKLAKVGIGTAINVGIKQARGEIIIFDLNNDDVVHEDWLRNLLSKLGKYDYNIVACGKRYIWGTKRIDSAGGRINRLVGDFPPIGHGSPDGPKFNRQCEVDYVPVVATSRKVLQKVGLCDEVYDIYFEDADFCYQAKRKGFRVMYVPEAKFYHLGSTTIGKMTRRSIYYFTRNRIRFIIKNFPTPFMLLSLFSTWPLYALAFPWRYKLFLQGSDNGFVLLQEDLVAFIKAVRWNINHLRGTIALRK